MLGYWTLKKLDVSLWIAIVSIHWLALVNTIMNLRVIEEESNLWSIWSTVCFSRRTLLDRYVAMDSCKRSRKTAASIKLLEFLEQFSRSTLLSSIRNLLTIVYSEEVVLLSVTKQAELGDSYMGCSLLEFRPWSLHWVLYVPVSLRISSRLKRGS
jgi:hypothetical protein